MSWTSVLSSMANHAVGSMFESDEPIKPDKSKFPSSSSAPTPAPPSAGISTGTSAAPVEPGLPGLLNYQAKLRSHVGMPAVLIKFQSTMEALAGSGISDEPSRIKTALAVMAQTADIRLEQVRDAYADQLKSIEEETGHFTQALEDMRKSQIETREADLAHNNQEIERKNAEIHRLAEKRDQLAGEIVVQKTNMAAARLAFDGAAAKLRGEIETAVNKLMPYTAATTAAATGRKP